MPFSSVADFRTSFKSWSKRTELTDGEIDDHVALFEAEFFADPEVRVRQMETVDDAFAVSDRLTALPTGFLELRSIQCISSPSYALTLITPQSAGQAYDYSTSDQGLHYIIEGSNLRIEPLPSPITLRLDYYKAPTTITGGTANWLLTGYPGIYLFGSLRYLPAYIGEDERKTTWEGYYQSARATFLAGDKRSKRAGSQPAMRLRSVV